jgi:NAD(P)-dependent dehydrogenase (short-subunit alcohol dehydrogenase family)
VAALARQALGLLGGVDVVVSNAGGQTHRPGGVLTFSDEDWQHDLDLNLMSAVRLDRALVPAMIAQGRGGSIVHVGSNAARLPRPASLPYTAAKAALTAYSKGLASEIGRHGIRVNVVLPGLIRTGALDTRMAAMASQAGTDPESVLDRTVAAMNIPLGRAGTADEVADLIAWRHGGRRDRPGARCVGTFCAGYRHAVHHGRVGGVRGRQHRPGPRPLRGAAARLPPRSGRPRPARARHARGQGCPRHPDQPAVLAVPVP